MSNIVNDYKASIDRKKKTIISIKKNAYKVLNKNCIMKSIQIINYQIYKLETQLKRAKKNLSSINTNIVKIAMIDNTKPKLRLRTSQLLKLRY